jgi:antitoxin component YwqK of YwqJK toxin-antitoxin module
METGSYLPIWEINIEWAELINENNSIEYVSNGIPSYPQAMKTGVWMQFEDDGKLSDKTTYVNGKIINNTK